VGFPGLSDRVSCWLVDRRVAKDFIIRLCKLSQHERYDSKLALAHPFITRNPLDPIPLTLGEELKEYYHSIELKKVPFRDL